MTKAKAYRDEPCEKCHGTGIGWKRVFNVWTWMFGDVPEMEAIDCHECDGLGRTLRAVA